MDIFIDIKSDDKVQLGDKFRFDLTKSFVPRPEVTAVAITKIEVDPEGTGTFLTIHDSSIPAVKFAPKDWYFDWIYQTKTNAVDSVITFSARFTASDLTVKTTTKSLTLLTAAEDNLFSTDLDLVAHEPDILKWIPEGRSTWNYVHRRAQERILSYLFEKGYKNTDGEPFTKDQILEKYDVKEWSTFMALKIIFGSCINSKDDVFVQKAQFYENLEGKASNTSIRVDLNSDGTQDGYEQISTNGPLLVRR